MATERGPPDAASIEAIIGSASIGWALYPHSAGTVEELIAAADVRLRGVKGSGKDNVLAPADLLPYPAGA